MSAEIFLKEAGYNKGYGGSVQITDVSKGIMGAKQIVGASFYLAAGAAWRARVRGTSQVANFAPGSPAETVHIGGRILGVVPSRLSGLASSQGNYPAA